METIIPSIIVLLGLLAILFEEKTIIRNVAFGLIGLSLVSLTHLGFAENDNQTLILGVTSGIIAFGLLMGFLAVKGGEWIALAGTFVFLVLQGKTATYFGYELTFSGVIAFLPLLGATGPIVSNLKAKLLHKWFGLDVEQTALGISAFYAALLIFFALFQAQYFGVVLVAAGWLATALASRTTPTITGGISLLSLGFLFVLMKTIPGVEDSFLRGNFLMGLVAGAAAISWVLIARKANKFRWGLMYVVPLLVILFMVFMGKANENFGGIPTYIGALLGTIPVLFLSGHGKQTIPFQALLIGVSGLVLSQFKPMEMPQKQSRLSTEVTTETVKEQQPDVLDIPAIATHGDLAGNWKSAIEASKVEFKLGPEGGVTKGGVEDFNVTLKMNEAGEPEKIAVILPTSKVTTFNPMRDESVRGPGYLNAAGFPKMGFTSTRIKKDGDKYIVSGNFEMLGKKSPLELVLKFAAAGSDKGEKFLVMVGKSTLDRTKFGMKSDSKIGDTVDVIFEVELRK